MEYRVTFVPTKSVAVIAVQVIVKAEDARDAISRASTILGPPEDWKPVKSTENQSSIKGKTEVRPHHKERT